MYSSRTSQTVKIFNVYLPDLLYYTDIIHNYEINELLWSFPMNVYTEI